MRILALGDSYLTGFLVGGYSFINILKDHYTIDNRGLNGGTTSDLKLITKQIENSYDLCVIHVGINDFLIGFSSKDVIKGIDDVVHELNRKVRSFIVISPIKITARSIEEGWSNSLSFQSTMRKQRDFNQEMKRYSNTKVQVLSFYDIFKDDFQEEFIDGIHPTAYLHKLMAEELDHFIGVMYHDP